MRQWRAIFLAGMCMVAQGTARAQGSIAESLRAAASAPPPRTADDTPAATLEDALHSLYRRADVVFTGEVTSIETVDGAVLIRFLVDDGVRGVATGAAYTLREWSGLWIDDPRRYAVGEYRLMLLHAPSAAGYASPVDGLMGAVRLHGDGLESTADLRWIATQVVAESTRMRPLLPSRTAVDSVHAASTPLATVPADGSVPAGGSATGASSEGNAHVDGAVVSGLLHAWRRVEDVQ